MSISPETLEEEPDDVKKERQRRTGVYGNGLHVLCRPDPYDMEVYQDQHRVLCITRPYQTCPTCPHSRFQLYFDANPQARFATVQCPRWERIGDRIKGMDPMEYETTEVATCNAKPFDFCPSCPKQGELVQIGADKQKSGWYGRWSSFTEEALEDG